LKSERRILWPTLAVAAVALWPSAVAADTGLPMLAVMWPLSWLAFPIIVVLEAVVAKHVLALSKKDSFLLALSANAWSTLIGIPLTWAALVVVEMLAILAVSLLGATMPAPGPIGRVIAAPFFAAWLPPLGGAERRWWVYGAAAFLCLPFFFASVHIETKVASRWVPEVDARRWAQRANALTYGLAVLGLLVSMALSLSRSR
jgi:hypothetical protein